MDLPVNTVVSRGWRAGVTAVLPTVIMGVDREELLKSAASQWQRHAYIPVRAPLWLACLLALCGLHEIWWLFGKGGRAPPPSPPRPPHRLCPLESSLQACRPDRYTSTRTLLGVSANTLADFTLVHYGPSDFVSSQSPSGPAFYEAAYTSFIIGLLRHVAGGSYTPHGTRAPDGHCVGTRSGDVWFLDIGANVGVHAVAVAAEGFPVVAVEASPATAERLRCSAALNRFSHLFVVNAAVDSVSGLPLCMTVPAASNFGMNRAAAVVPGGAPATPSWPRLLLD